MDFRFSPVVLVFLVFQLLGCHNENESSSSLKDNVSLGELSAKLELTEQVNQFMTAIDSKDFDRVRSFIHKDAKSTAVFGGVPSETVGPEAIVKPWIDALTPVAKVHHQVSNFVIRSIDAGTYSVDFYGIAAWYRPEAKEPVTWFVGDYSWVYTRTSSGWVVTKMLYRNKFINPSL